MASATDPPHRRGRKSEHHRRKFDHVAREEALAALAARQHVVFGLAQLRELGFGARAVQQRVGRRRWYRVHQGVYSLVPPKLLTRKGRYVAAVLACGPGAALSHRSAAVLHGLKDWGADRIEVTVPRGAPRARPGILVRRSKTLLPRDTTVVDGIPCTTIARTLLDLGAVVNRRGLEIAFDRADQQDKLDVGEVQEQLERHPRHRGGRRVRALLADYYIGSTPTESDLEEVALALCRRLGIPTPKVQRWLLLPDGGPAVRPDFTWPEQKVILEADGDRVHGTRQAREQRNVRDQRLLAHGWVPLHASWRQVTRRPEELASTLVKLVRWPQPARPRAAAG